MKHVGVVIPVRNVLGLTQHAVETFKSFHRVTLIIVDDRSDRPMKDWLKMRDDIVSIIDPPDSTGLSYNWNIGIKKAIELGCTHILVSNNDVLIHKETVDNLIERIDRGDVVMATGVNAAGQCPTPPDIHNLVVGEESETEHPDFSCFMITPDTIEKIGWFDENYLGAYCEDCDYHARIALAGEKAVTYNRAPYYHYASATIKENPHLSFEIHDRHARNESYFARKWGTAHVGDVPVMRQVYWKHPFNDPSKTIKDW